METIGQDLPVEIRFGGELARSCTLTLRRGSLSNRLDYWDDNWIFCSVMVSTRSFQGRVNGLIRAEEIGEFHDQVANLYQRLTGTATFETMEGWLRVCLTGDGRGHLEFRGQVCDDLADGNVLKFCLPFDQTDLPPVLANLQAARIAFPLVGRENS